ncbi:MAG: shikimate kinase [Oscillospiraceae bacterium]|nr:shikimate kinase [Oscillospiraceae bacterium]
MDYNIYLIGFMGCGKTKIGKILSKSLDYEFLDLDMHIQNLEKMSISDIFDKKGEHYFRKLESKILLETSNIKKTIVSTGGGIIESNKNRIFLKNKKTFFLEVPFQFCYKRIIVNTTNRPLVKQNSFYQLNMLFKKREKIYRQCSLLSVNNSRKSYTVLEDIHNYLNKT